MCCRIRFALERPSDLLDMENSQSCKIVLPEDLVEKIVAMVPFPHVFKARALSKSWLARFAPISSLDDEVEKRHAASFQKQVGEWSQNWETFFSIIFGKQLSLAYDWASGNQSRLPSLSFLPEKFQVIRSNPEIEGPLIYGCVRSTQLMFVANILTKTWKKLPPHLNAGGSIFCWKKLVMGRQSKSYKLVVFCRDPQNSFYRCSAHIYDSKSNAWTCKKLWVSKTFRTLSPPVLLNGVLYTVADHEPQNLLAFNVEEETLEEIIFNLPFADGLSITSVLLVACNTNLLMIVTEVAFAGGLHVLKIDLQSQQLLEVARGPPAAFNLPGFKSRQPVSDGTSVFFGMTFGSGDYMHMVAYNWKQDRWRCFAFPYDMSRAFQDMTHCDWSSVSFQPGLNPFLEV